LISGEKSGANFSFKTCCNHVKEGRGESSHPDFFSTFVSMEKHILTFQIIVAIIVLYFFFIFQATWNTGYIARKNYIT